MHSVKNFNSYKFTNMSRSSEMQLYQSAFFVEMAISFSTFVMKAPWNI